MSTSMPIDVQTRMIASIPGLEDAEMIRPGYAIEYDAVDARESITVWKCGNCRVCSSPDRSTAPPGTKKRPVRV